MDRKSHDQALTVGAQRAILALREVKDSADGHARARDLEGIERARRVGSTKMSLDAEVTAHAGEDDVDDEGEGPTEVEGEGEGSSEQDGFCSTCFTPLLPDPRPEQLFIWLHAMRCASTFPLLSLSSSSSSSSLVADSVDERSQTRRSSGTGRARSPTGPRRRTRCRCRPSCRDGATSEQQRLHARPSPASPRRRRPSRERSPAVRGGKACLQFAGATRRHAGARAAKVFFSRGVSERDSPAESAAAAATTTRRRRSGAEASLSSPPSLPSLWLYLVV